MSFFQSFFTTLAGRPILAGRSPIGLTLALVLGLFLGWGDVSQAKPLDLQAVSANALWLAHVDVNAIKTSTVVQRAYDRCLAECPDAHEHLNKVRAMLGFDLTEDIQDITFYGNKIKKGSGVAILRAKVDQPYLLGKVQGAPGYKSSTHGAYTLHSWTHNWGKHHEHRVTGCFHTPTELIFGRTEAEVIAALDVLDGKSPNLAGSDSSLAAKVPAGTTIVVRVQGLADADLPTKSPLLKQSDALSLVMGEHDGESFATVRLQARSDEVAAEVDQVLQGFAAMAHLRGQDFPDALKAIDAVHVRTEGQVVTAKFRESADDVWEYGQKIVERFVAASHGKFPLK